MSHFTTIIFSNTASPEELANLLAPYHEFECTGRVDQYVQDIDKTEDARRSYLSRGESWADTSEVDYIADWYGLKIVPFGETPNLNDQHKYGYILVDAEGKVTKCVDRTNPNSKWDWYQIGGRWAGYFKPKTNSSSGVQGEKSWAWQPDGITDDWVDSIKKKDIDIEGIRNAEIKKANEIYDTLESILRGRTLPSWKQIREKYPKDIEKAQLEYTKLDVVKDLSKHEYFRWCIRDLVETYGTSREEYVQKQSDSILVPFAFIGKYGEWNERGEIGYWGTSSNDKDETSWCQIFWDAFNAFDDETYLTLMDCHI
jgi:hypothetical protein